MVTDKLYRIVAPHFVCGIITQDGKVMQCAPIVHYMFGWMISNVQRYCERKNWVCEPVQHSKELETQDERLENEASIRQDRGRSQSNGVSEGEPLR